jgi:hypothetical protein
MQYLVSWLKHKPLCVCLTLSLNWAEAGRRLKFHLIGHLKHAPLGMRLILSPNGAGAVRQLMQQLISWLKHKPLCVCLTLSLAYQLMRVQNKTCITTILWYYRRMPRHLETTSVLLCKALGQKE